MIIWVLKIFFFLFFLYSSYVYSCHLFLISSASLRSIPFLRVYRAHLCMKCSLGNYNFLEEISSLSHSVVFLYFFALITEEGFLICSCYSLKLYSDAYIFPFLLCVSLLFFSQLFLRPPQTAILLFLYFFSMGMVLIPVSMYNVMNLHP